MSNAVVYGIAAGAVVGLLLVGCAKPAVLVQTNDHYQRGVDATVAACTGAVVALDPGLLVEHTQDVMHAYNRCLFDNGAML